MKEKILLFLVIVFALANVVIWGAVIGAHVPQELEVAFLDVGQGDSIFIRAPNGNEMLIDAGRNGRVLRDLGEVMPFFDRSIDVIIPTHPDADHIAGFFDVLRRYSVSAALLSGAHSETKLDDELHLDLKQDGIRMMDVKNGTILDLGSGVLFEIISPNFDPTHMKTNNASVVGKLTYGNTSFLLTGDAPSEVEHYLVERYGPILHADVLKAGHHGSKYSSSLEFLEAVDPEYTVFSVGENNYGHPAPETIARVKKAGSKIISTKKRGTIIFRSDGKKISLESDGSD